MSILESCEKNKEKFEEVKKIALEIKEIYKKKEVVVSSLKDIYNVAFKSFNKNREPTGLFIKGMNDWSDKKEVEIFLNTKGFSVKKGRYDTNTSFLDTAYANFYFIKILKQLKEIENSLLNVISKESSKENFKNYLGGVENVSLEEGYSVQLNLEVKNYESSSFSVKEMKFEKERCYLNANLVERFCPELSFGHRGMLTINLGYQTLIDKFLIEQVYPVLIFNLKNYLEVEKERLKTFDNYLEGVKLRFAKHLIMNSLRNK